MTINLIKIGNSRGVRLPRELLESYRLREGDEIEIEERQEGILLRPKTKSDGKLGWEVSYREMAEEAAESAEWADWDSTAGDGIDAAER